MLNVLIIDDDKDMRFGVKRILTRCGHTVHEAVSGEQAFEQLSQEGIDVVFCDLRFPGQLSGENILDTISTQYPDIKVVMMSCGMDYDTKESLLQNGACAALQKPFFKADCQHLLSELFPAFQQAA